MSRAVPALTPAVVTDDEQLAAAVDAFLDADATDREHRQKIGKLQTELRRRVDDETWMVFLELDDAIGARLADVTAAITGWAFVEGQLDVGRRERGGS
jgi:hypothetical protein